MDRATTVEYLMGIVDGNCWGIYILLLDLTSNRSENATCGPTIPVQRSNRLSYRGQLLSSNHTFVCIPGVENIADHRTIGPRKFFMLAERKKSTSVGTKNQVESFLVILDSG